jgi:hypothetical protein
VDAWPPIARWLIGIGIALVLAGLLWPLLSRLGFGRLPGDIVVERDGFRLTFPLMSCIVISALLSLIFWLLRR